jgi:hypothetical protein
MTIRDGAIGLGRNFNSGRDREVKVGKDARSGWEGILIRGAIALLLPSNTISINWRYTPIH